MASTTNTSRHRMGVRRLRAALLGTMLLPVAGCSVGPDYKKPSLWSPSQWHNRTAPDKAVGSVVDASPPDPSWWNIFNDPELSALEARAAQTNLDVRLATARLAESRAQLRVTAADRYPSINGTGSYTREKVSDKLVQRGLQDTVSGLPVAGSTVDGVRQYAGEAKVPAFDLWSDGIDASWEVDLWGRVRREVESAKASVAVSAEDRRSVLIARLAEVARDYMMLRGTQTLLEIARANQKTAEETLALTRARFQGGLTTELDVQNALAQLDSTIAEIPNDEQQVSQQINALSLLLGEPPQALRQELERAAPVPPIPPQVPAGLPSELARRRPDIREAEAQLHAATANVGVAVANFYPRVTLSGALNFESLSYRDLAFWSSSMWTLGPSISLPIFQGGRLRGQLQLSKAQQQEAAISYQQTVLSAWRDVDDALIAYGAEQQRHDRLGQTAQAAQRALDLAREQYTHGLDTYLNVLDAQRTLLSAQQQLASSTTTVSSNLVQLYTALGGGWEATFPDKVDAGGHDRLVASGGPGGGD